MIAIRKLGDSRPLLRNGTTLRADIFLMRKQPVGLLLLPIIADLPMNVASFNLPGPVSI